MNATAIAPAPAPAKTEAECDVIAGSLEIYLKMMPEGESYEEDAKVIGGILRAAGVEYLRIAFDGSGDSGSIEGIYFDDSWSNQATGKLSKLLEEWAYRLLENTGVDWYNNDGGHGEIIFNMAEKKFSYEVYYRVSSSELGDSGEEEI